MRRLFKRKNVAPAFSLLEVLIAIAVLSVGILGTVASIAFGVRASKVGADNTEAVLLNSRILELILAGGPRGPVLGGTVNNAYSSSLSMFNATGTPNATTGPPIPLYDPNSTSNFALLPTSSGGYNFNDNDFVNTADTTAVTGFHKMAQNYSVGIVVRQYDTTTSNADSQLYNVTVGLQWWDKGMRKTSLMSGVYRAQ